MKYILAMACCLVSNILFAQFDAEDYKSASNTDVVNTLKTAVEQIDRIERFSRIFSDDDDKKPYTKDELLPAFRPDTTRAIQVFNELKDTRLRLIQSFTAKDSKLKIDDGDFHEHLSGKTYSIQLVPEKIYFYDGTTATENVEHIPLDLSFPEEIPFRKRIDSISCKIRLQYTTAFDKVEVNALQPLSAYKGKFIKITKTNQNDIEYVFHKDLDFDIIEGLNASGKVLDDKSYTTRNSGQKDLSIFYTIKKPLEKIIASAEQDTSLSREAFQQKYLSRIEAEFRKIPDSDTQVTTARYKGAIKGLRMYIAKEKKEQTATFMIKRQSFDDIHFGLNEEDQAILTDNNGNTLLTVRESIAEINPYFYENNQSFLYFNIATLKLEKLPYYSVKKLTAHYAAAQEDEKADYILLNKKNEKLGTFEEITAYENTVIALRGNHVLLINPDDQQVQFNNLDQLSEMYNGYAVIAMKGKYGFINEYGKQVIPAEYDGAVPFKEMDGYTAADLLFAVKKGSKWGFVNMQNQTVIPFEYDEVLPFSYGISMAVKDQNRGLINTRNQVIAPFENGSSYGLSTNFGKRFYSLGSGNYNHLGKKEKKD